jgi:hypothetical protein
LFIHCGQIIDVVRCAQRCAQVVKLMLMHFRDIYIPADACRVSR